MNKIFTQVFFVLSLLVIVTTNALIAQTGERYTEQEIRLQDEFLKAKIISVTQEYDKAIIAFKDLYDMDRNNGVVARELSKLYTIEGNLVNALIFAQKAVDNEPKNKVFKEELADLYEQNFQFDKAADVYSQLATSLPENRQYYHKLAYNQLSSGHPQEALSTLNILESKVGIKEESSRGKFEIYQTMGDDVAAEQELKALSTAYPDETRYLHNLASFYQKRGQFEKQEAIYEQILVLDPNDGIAQVNYSISQIDPSSKGNYLSSLKSLYSNPAVPLKEKIKELIPFVNDLNPDTDIDSKNKLVELVDVLIIAHPTEAPVYAIQGDINFKTADYAQAIESYKKTLELDPTVYNVWTQLFYAQIEEEQYEGLTIYGEKALDIFPNQPLNYYMVAKGFINMNRPDEATDYIMEGSIVAGKNKSIKSDFDMLKAGQYILKNDHKKALQLIDQLSIDTDIYSPEQLEVIGDLYIQLNESKKAKSIYLKAQKLGYNNPKFNQKISALEE